MGEAEFAGETRHFCRFCRCGGAQTVIDRQDKEPGPVRACPLVGQVQEREGVAAAGDGKADRPPGEIFRHGAKRRVKTRGQV
jgi:hypothetical protein